ncbi:MAG: carbohydrate binding family 9 domain-containing protein, partial [Terriglobus roseus]|nr:carbohydrate binding family 9 domain-containing protein [Terriglobus roseus]
MCLAALSLVSAGAQQTPAPPGSAQLAPNAPTHLAPPQTLQIPLLDRPVSLADFSNMEPVPALRGKLAYVAELSQNQPFDTKPASERTEVWLGRTRTTLFVVFACHDSRPNLMRAHLARRENIDQDDYVSLLVDPFQDRRRGILFEVNPLGVQADANWSETDDPDFSYDQIWDSSARRTPKGWMALMAIPFRSIRSRSTAPEWGLVLGRNLPRLSETDYWPHISQQISGTLSQEGTARGLEGATSHNFQINPYVIGHRIRQLNEDDPLNPYFSNRNFAGTGGGDIKAIIKDSIVLDGTINPDFSQVESDQPQFRINQRFAVYYPELRPFFLENSSYFDTPITLLYTRTIIHPEFGARATGKIGRTNIGFLSIDDRAPGEFVAHDDPLHGKRALTTVMRISEDLGKQSSIGVTYAQRQLDGNANVVGGIDFRAYLNKHWIMNGMWVESSTHQQDGTYSAGPASRLSLFRNGRSFNLNIRYRDFSQGFEADAGFTSIPQVRQVNSNASYSWYPNKHGIQSVQIQPQLNIAFDRGGNRVFHYNENDLIFTLPRNGLIIPFVGNNSDTLSPASFPALAHYTNFTENYTGALIRLAP